MHKAGSMHSVQEVKDELDRNMMMSNNGLIR